MEKRNFTTSFRADGKRLTGLAAVYDSPTQIVDGRKSYTEIIRRGAFRNALASGGDIIATFNHDPSRLLGRTSSGTLTLRDTDAGLEFSIDLPEHASDVREMVARGDITGASFTFGVRHGGQKWTDNQHRELTDLYLAEVGPVVTPAYAATSVALRSAPLDIYRLRIELAEKQ
jgi:uncharacterized protein